MCSRGLSADKKPGHCDLDSVLKCDLPLPGEILDTVNAKQEVNVCMQQVSPDCGFDRAANTYWLEELRLSTKHSISVVNSNEPQQSTLNCQHNFIKLKTI